MSHTNTFDKTIPLGTERMGLGTQRMRDLKQDTQERMELDHYWGVEIDTTDAGADGYHKKVRLPSISTPTAMADAVILYGQAAPTKRELFIIDEDSHSRQLTDSGNIRIIGDSIDYSTCFCARRGSNFTITTAPAIVPFNVEYFDSYADHNTTTGIFTAPSTGVYKVFLRAMVYPSTTPSGYFEWYYDATISIRKNGTAVYTVGFNAKARQYSHWITYPVFVNTTAESLSISKILNLTASDTIDIYAEGYSWWQDYTRAWNIVASDSHPHIHGYGDCVIQNGSTFSVTRLF